MPEALTYANAMEKAVMGLADFVPHSLLFERIEQLEQGLLQAPETTRKALLDLLQEARETVQQHAEAYALCLLGGCAFFQGNFTETLLFAQYALRLSQKLGLRDLEARCLNAYGLASNRVGKYDEALEAYLRSREIANDLADDTARSRVIINLAAAYSDLEDHERLPRGKGLCQPGGPDSVLRRCYAGHCRGIA